MQTARAAFLRDHLPPLKGKDINSIYEGIDPLLEFKPSFINVTYHREEVLYKERGQGLLREDPYPKTAGHRGHLRHDRGRVQHRHGAAPDLWWFHQGGHRGRADGAEFPASTTCWHCAVMPSRANHRSFGRDGHAHTTDLIRQISRLNKGQYLYEEELEAARPIYASARHAIRRNIWRPSTWPPTSLT